MDKCREAFERKWNIKIFVKLCIFDDSINEYSSDKLHDYTLGFINGAWWEFQEQQKRVDKLQAEVKKLIEEYKSEEKELELKEWEQSTIYGRIAIELEEALKGGEV